MRIDCYNACACNVSSVEYGDTFYYEDRLYIKVRMGDSVGHSLNGLQLCYIVALDIGELIAVEPDTQVILADTKVVVNTRDIQ